MSADTEQALVDKLKSFNTTEVYDALMQIRKSYVRNADKMEKLQKYSVIKLIIPFMEHPKFCNVSLSIVADGCLELSFVNEVIKYDGIKSLIRIMKSSINEDIQNRACRAMGNMAKFGIGYKAIHLMKPLSNIINFLSETSNANCQQTAIRTLMNLAKSTKSRELITRENGIIYIAKLLHSSDVQLLNCSLKAIANLTQHCNINCTRQLLDMELHKILVKLHSHSEKSVRNHALISLKNLSSQEEIRSGLVKEGAVKLFTDVIIGSESFEMCRFATLALCSCLDHMHMWSHNGTDRSVGLKALLTVLKNVHLQDIHIHVIRSLISISYESNISDILISLDIIQVLVEILKSFIEKHKCKSKSSLKPHASEKETFFSLCKKDKDSETDLYEGLCHKPENGPYKEDKIYLSYGKSHNINHSLKEMHKWEHPFHSLSSVTSDYSSSCSPHRMCSPLLRNPASPEINYEADVGSPSTGCTSSGIWSPVFFIDESVHRNIHCWSPVVSNHSISSTSEGDLELYDNEENVQTGTSSFTSFTKILPIPEAGTQKNNVEPSVISNTSLFEYDSSDEANQVLTLKTKNCSNDLCQKNSKIQALKKIKTEHLLTGESTEFHSKLSMDNDSQNFVADEKHTLDMSKKVSDFKHACEDKSECRITAKRQKLKTDNANNNGSAISSFQASVKSNTYLDQNDQSNTCDNQNSNIKIPSETVEMKTIDHYVIALILQLSFHLEKKINSQIADKFCFSVLIDYLCLIHNPNLKAKIILSNLIKNRYCFEKLITNGFILELEEKMASPDYLCIYCSDIKQIYSDLINIGKQAVETDYGIGTLSHLLVTAEKMGQFHAICAMSKIVTEKTLLYRILIEATGLSSLISFLSDCDAMIQRNAVICLCQIYQSLNRDQKINKCCFKKTCQMTTSSKCSYKNSYLDVTFSVSGGGKILANRDKICKNSEYFYALLQGHFQESNTELVFLPDISAENLSTIFHFLHGCGSGNVCPYIKRIPSLVLLELLRDCEKFLLFNIKTFVEDRLCHRLSPSLVSKTYKQSKIHNSPALNKRAIKYFLSMDVLKKDLIWIYFQELQNTDNNFGGFFISDLENVLRDKLCQI